MDGTRLTFGVLPVRRAIRAQGLAALQFLGVASDLHGQDGNAGQSLEQVFNPARIFADDVVGRVFIFLMPLPENSVW